MKTTAVITFVAAVGVAASNITRCTKEQFDKVNSDAQWSPWYGWCASDIGLSRSELKEHVTPTQENQAHFNNSRSCRWLYGDIQRYASKQHCYELDLIANNITWPMVVSLMDMEVVPKVTTNCSKVNLTAAFTSLALKPSFFTCLGTSAKSFVTHIPDATQLQQLRENEKCADLFAEVQAIIVAQPHCAIDGDGTDIHIFEKLTWNVTLDWLAILADSKTAPNVHGAVQFALTSVPQGPHHANTATLFFGVLFAGALVAFVAMNVIKRRQEKPAASRGEERISLLRV